MSGHGGFRNGLINTEFPTELPAWLFELQKRTSDLQKTIDIIPSLHYPSISERETQVKDRHPRTLEWLFDKSNDTRHLSSPSLIEWLEQGNDIFWISGKAGCGKSTLMKYLCNDPRTDTALKNWAGEKDLLVAKFFFWSAGTTMQKTQQGLLQSLLMCILKQHPALTPRLCPRRWNSKSKLNEDEAWTAKELTEALTGLKREISTSAKICIFIDGVDEYDGEIAVIIQLIRDLSSSGSVKVCFASRPWNIFETNFRENDGRKIVLQQLNRPDIWQFACDNLTAELHSHLGLLSVRETELLVKEIVERSSGVFLWVFLVVKSLVRGLTNLDTLQELWARLQELPTDLEEFFDRILNRGDKIYGKQSARLYMIQMNATESALSALDIAHFAENSQCFALEDKICLQHATNAERLDAIVRIRVLARCQDLLEFSDSGSIQFLHRTVKDFLETKDIMPKLIERAGKDFDPHLFICNAMLIQIKAVILHICLLAKTKKFARQCYPLKHITACFWAHFGKLPQIDQTSLQILAAFEEAISRIYRLSERSGYCASMWREISAVDYHKGWSADAAVERGDLRLLKLLQIGKAVPSLIQKARHSKSPLEMALIDMRSEKRLATVNYLLDSGAEPNERLEGNETAWRSYLAQLKMPSDSRLWILEKEILSELILHGADSSLLHDKTLPNHRLLSKVAQELKRSIWLSRYWLKEGYADVDNDKTIDISATTRRQRPELPIRPKKRPLVDDDDDEEQAWQKDLRAKVHRRSYQEIPTLRKESGYPCSPSGSLIADAAGGGHSLCQSPNSPSSCSTPANNQLFELEEE